jgi:hypothetical protein
MKRNREKIMIKRIKEAIRNDNLVEKLIKEMEKQDEGKKKFTGTS